MLETESNRTFGLTAARTDEIYDKGTNVAGPQRQENDRSVYGPILMTRHQDRVLIRFLEHSEYSYIWKKRFLFKLSHYSIDTMSHLDWDLVSESDEQGQSLKLNDESSCPVELRTQRMTD